VAAQANIAEAPVRLQHCALEVAGCAQGPIDKADKAGVYLAVTILRNALPAMTLEAAARAAITGVQAGVADPAVFVVGELAVDTAGAVVGHISSDGNRVLGFDGSQICEIEPVRLPPTMATSTKHAAKDLCVTQPVANPTHCAHALCPCTTYASMLLSRRF
jgi:hypothetical protein